MEGKQLHRPLPRPPIMTAATIGEPVRHLPSLGLLVVSVSTEASSTGLRGGTATIRRLVMLHSKTSKQAELASRIAPTGLDMARMEDLLLDCASKDKQAVPGTVSRSGIGDECRRSAPVPPSTYLVFAAVPGLEAVPARQVPWRIGICTPLLHGLYRDTLKEGKRYKTSGSLSRVEAAALGNSTYLSKRGPKK
ncbi:hypothetical protein CCMA1212_004904 [Trichoderma ghanense]|uniref:Uncharacterized protein n=1 Tax=Trichoderma ghanense TaxID=65468 RepID=A0ABY2H4R5_9HYPO